MGKVVYLQAQNVLESLNDTATIHPDQAPAGAAPIMAKKWNQVRTKHFALNLGLAFLFDFNTASQDANSIAQVGKVSSATEWRGERIVLSGTFFSSAKNPWRYIVAANFNGLDAPEGKKSFDFLDWNIEMPLSKTAGWITLGKQKEGVGLEYILPGTQGMFTERGSGAPAFVRQRNIGIRYSNSVMKQRMTYTVGFFNNYWETGNSASGNGSQVTARITGLPHYSADNDLLHIGIAYRYTDATNGKLSYKAKPEMNTATQFINTGSFDADKAGTIMFEGMLVKGPIAFIGEYMNVAVKSAKNNDPHFSYYQIGGSWFITGDNRKYNKMTGNPGKLIPKKIFSLSKKRRTGAGAFELGARFTKTNLTDGLVNGGAFNRFTTAFSWYPNAHFRYEINYGHGRLDKNNLIGKTNFWQFRIQFEL